MRTIQKHLQVFAYESYGSVFFLLKLFLTAEEFLSKLIYMYTYLTNWNVLPHLFSETLRSRRDETNLIGLKPIGWLKVSSGSIGKNVYLV